MPKRSAADLDAIAAICAVQSGLITARQLQEAGVRRSTLQHRIRTGGPWRRLLPGIYLVTGAAPDRHQQRLAALLFAGAGAALTGIDALVLLGVLDESRLSSEPVHVLVPHDRKRSSRGFVVIERTRRPAATRTVDGLEVVTVARATVDHARRLDRRSDVSALMSRAIQRDHVSLHELDDEVRTAHRRSTALVREAMDDLYAGTRSAPEGALRRIWLASGLVEPLWNPRLTAADGSFIACPDAYVPEVGVAIEVDSVEFHFAADAWKRTQERQTRMAAHGIVVFPLAPSRIAREPDHLMAAIAATIRSNEGRPRPHVIVTTARNGDR